MERIEIDSNINRAVQSMFPEERFRSLRKIDGIIGLVFFCFLVLWSIEYLYLVKYKIIPMPYGYALSKLFRGFISSFPSLIVILLTIFFRKQPLSSIGISKKGLGSSFVIGIAFIVTFFVSYFYKHRFSYDVLYLLIYYVIFVGLSEELSFRGFLWPRLVITFGKLGGTLFAGALFGIAHAPLQIIIYNQDITNSILSNIGGGIVYSLFMIYIYTRNQNILLPSFFHGFWDACSLI